MRRQSRKVSSVRHFITNPNPNPKVDPSLKSNSKYEVNSDQKSPRPKPAILDAFESNLVTMFPKRNILAKSLSKFARRQNFQDINFDCTKPVYERLKLKDAGEHFWKIGLRHYKETRKPQAFWRWQFFNLLVHLVFLSRSLFILGTMTDDRELIIKIGDFYTLMDPGAGRVYLHICILSLQVFLIYSTLRYLIYQPFTWFGLHEVLRGEKAPADIGIYDLDVYLALHEKTRTMFKVGDVLNKIGKAMMVFLYGGISIWAMEEFWELYWLGPHIFFLLFWKDLMVSGISWQFSYFNIGCYSLKQRLVQVNKWVTALNKYLENPDAMAFIINAKMKRIYKTLVKIQLQVIACQHNLGFFIPSAIVTFMFTVVACWYYSGFTKARNFFFQSLFFYWGCFFYLQMTFLFTSASMVTKAGKKCYKQFVRMAATRQNIPAWTRIKMLELIESFSNDKRNNKKFGFHCYTWFLLSNNLYVAISLLTSSFMLNAIKASSSYD